MMAASCALATDRFAVTTSVASNNNFTILRMKTKLGMFPPLPRSIVALTLA